MGVTATATQDSTFEWSKVGAQVISVALIAPPSGILQKEAPEAEDHRCRRPPLHGSGQTPTISAMAARPKSQAAQTRLVAAVALAVSLALIRAGNRSEAPFRLPLWPPGRQSFAVPQ
jgi:hypothetical protein